MAQGKMKVKNAVPSAAKTKKNKGRAVTRRSNAPVKSKSNATDRNKMKVAVSKMVNQAAERQLRAQSRSQPTLSAAQQRAATAATAPTEAAKGGASRTHSVQASTMVIRN